MELRRIPFENVTVVAVLDDAQNVMATGAFETKEDVDEATRMISVLLANLGLVKGVSTGILPMPYKKFRATLNSITTK